MTIKKNKLKIQQNNNYKLVVCFKEHINFFSYFLDEMENEDIKALGWNIQGCKEELIVTNITNINSFLTHLCDLFEIKRNYLLSLTIKSDTDLRLFHINTSTYPQALVVYDTKKYGFQSFGVDLFKESFNVFC